MKTLDIDRQSALILGANTYAGPPCKRGHAGHRYTHNAACIECDKARATEYRNAHKDDEQERHRLYKQRNRESVNSAKRQSAKRNRAKLRVKEASYRERDPNGRLAVKRQSSELRAKQRLAITRLLAPLRKWVANTEAKDAYNARTPAQIECERVRSAANYQARKQDPVWKALRDERMRVKAHNRRSIERGGMGRLSIEQIREIKAAHGHKCAYCGSPDNLHLDHKIPLSRGGVHEVENMQVLCAFHNISKNDKTDDEYRLDV